MKPYYDHAGITIYHGDCREIAPHLTAQAIVSDPPYGMGWNASTARFSGGHAGNVRKNGGGRRDQPRIVGDAGPFDPRQWLQYSEVILFGCNHFASRLPIGTTLVWIKRLEGAFGSFLSDAEVAWQKGGHGVYCFRDLSMNGKAHNREHPTEKPLSLMSWCIQRIRAIDILDPYMGSGSTLVAAKGLGRKATGIEIEERYCEIAANRLAQEVLF